MCARGGRSFTKRARHLPDGECSRLSMPSKKKAVGAGCLSRASSVSCSHKGSSGLLEHCRRSSLGARFERIRAFRTSVLKAMGSWCSAPNVSQGQFQFWFRNFSYSRRAIIVLPKPAGATSTVTPPRSGESRRESSCSRGSRGTLTGGGCNRRATDQGRCLAVETLGGAARRGSARTSLRDCRFIAQV